MPQQLIIAGRLLDLEEDNMIELKPLYLCIDTSKAVPLTQNGIEPVHLENLDTEEITETQSNNTKTDP